MRALRVTLAVILGAGLLFALGLLDFQRRLQPSSQGGMHGQAGVVFTGQPYRVAHGLALLGQGRTERLFISGANRRSGVRPETFVTQFALTPALAAALATGQIELGVQAQSTLENAAETACWYRENQLTGPVILVTSRHHMPRASLLLENRMRGVAVLREPVVNRRRPPNLPREFGLYLATRLLLLLPDWSAEACPAR